MNTLAPIYTTAEVADLLRLERKAVIRLAKSAGVGMKVGGPAGYRFDESDIDAIKDHLRRQNTPEPENAA